MYTDGYKGVLIGDSFLFPEHLYDEVDALVHQHERPRLLAIAPNLNLVLRRRQSPLRGVLRGREWWGGGVNLGTYLIYLWYIFSLQPLKTK